jgi:UDP-N-acetylglucosamine 1-carboxyvinyltransferase
MDMFIIHGPSELRGTVEINGAKNAVLPLMAAALLARGKSVIQNVPRLRDVQTMIQLLEILGARVTFDKSVLTIDTTRRRTISCGRCGLRSTFSGRSLQRTEGLA